MPALNPIPAEYKDCLCPECLKLFIKGPNSESTKIKPD